MEKSQNSTQSIWRKKGERNAFACVRDRPQANICPALSYSGPAALTPGRPPQGGTPRAVIQTPSGESLAGGRSWAGRLACWAAKSFDGEVPTILCFREQAEAWGSVEMNGTYSRAEKTVLTCYLGANACWVLVQNHDSCCFDALLCETSKLFPHLGIWTSSINSELSAFKLCLGKGGEEVKYKNIQADYCLHPRMNSLFGKIVFPT